MSRVCFMLLCEIDGRIAQTQPRDKDRCVEEKPAAGGRTPGSLMNLSPTQLTGAILPFEQCSIGSRVAGFGLAWISGDG